MYTLTANSEGFDKNQLRVLLLKGSVRTINMSNYVTTRVATCYETSMYTSRPRRRYTVTCYSTKQRPSKLTLPGFYFHI